MHTAGQRTKTGGQIAPRPPSSAGAKGSGITHHDALPSPALVLDLDALDANIAAMATHAARTGIGLRPHAKSHKCTQIARRLAKAGALGVSCATIAEAEAMAAAGLAGILLTSPLAGPDMLHRLGKLLLRDSDLMVVVDDPRNLADLAEVASKAGRTLPVLVELDVGQGRTGCVDVEGAVTLARLIAERHGVAFAGVQAYWGHLQQASPFSERQARVDAQVGPLRELVERLKGEGLPPEIVTGGGTGTSFIDPELGVFTEIQPGSFLFLDSCYGSIPIDENGSPFVESLFVSAAVVSATRPGRVIVNAGFKALAADSGRPVPRRGAPAGASFTFMGDEHGAIDFDRSAASPQIGGRIELLTSHCDPTVSLHGRYFVIRGKTVIDEWPVEARY